MTYSSTPECRWHTAGPCRSALAAGAVEARSGALDDPADRPPAHTAGQACPVVHKVLALEVPGRAVGPHEVAQRATAGGQGIGERSPHRGSEPLAASEGEAVGCCPGVDPRAEQALVRVDVPHAGHESVVHQELLDGDAPSARRGVEAATGECARERLHPEMREERVARRVADVPEDGAEAPRIAKAHCDVADAEIEMIVGSRRLGGRNDPQAARHAEMEDQGSLAAIEEEVLRAARDGANPFAAQDRIEIARHGPAQGAMAHDHPGNLPPAQMRLQPEPGDFYFRKLWHAPLELGFLWAADICCCRAAEIYLN